MIRSDQVQRTRTDRPGRKPLGPNFNPVSLFSEFMKSLIWVKANRLSAHVGKRFHGRVVV